MHALRKVLFSLAFVVAAGCVRDSVSTRTAVTVVVAPHQVTTAPRDTVTFTATVSGADSPDVTWAVREPAGGTVDASGKYTAPSTAGSYHVVATSVADTSSGDVAVVTVSASTVSVSVSPHTASVLTNGSVVFSATVSGTAAGQSTGVTWSVQEAGGGSIDASGRYTAPSSVATYHVVATSIADGSATATATVNVTTTPVVAVAVSPTTASVVARGAVSFTATVTGTTAGQSTAVTWSVQEAGGGTVSSSGAYTAPATAGTYHVVATSVADPSKNDVATVTVAPPPPITVTVSPHVVSLAPSGSATFIATVSNTTGNQSTAVSWSVQEANGGSIDSAGKYTAPGAAGGYHVVATSVADSTKSDTATVTVYTTPLIAADRITTWNPGLTAIGGIPNRTTIYMTLSPSGGDDTGQLQAALDSCPADQVVKLNPGTFKINGNGLRFRTSNCTLRGSGTGTPGSGAGGTRVIKADRDTNPSYAILYMGDDPSQVSSSTNLASDAVKGTNSLVLTSNPGLTVGEIVLVDQITDNDPDVFWGPNHDPPGGGSRRWFCRQDRSLNQMMEVTAVSGNTVTFATPFHITFKTAYTAQLSRYPQPAVRKSGIEDIYFYGGMGGDWHGNLSIELCAYCWVKNVESHWTVGTSVGFYGTYRSELRDSYIHETPDPNPGGAGYLTGLNYGASDNLIENNILWYGNKTVIMRASGGGNVFAYNYLDDSFGQTYPNLPEAGLNAGHATTPHMELLEGNYSHQYKGDAFWGSSIYITVFRNHLSGLRHGLPPLNTFTWTAGGSVYPYIDEDRNAVDIQDHSLGHNIIGNVIGFQGQTLISYSGTGYSFSQSSFEYEQLADNENDNRVHMYRLGQNQADHSGNTAPWDTTFASSYALQRDGNWDWTTQSQKWHGVGGTGAGTGTPQPIPNSLYLSQKPAFFGSNRWPWVDPTTGAVYTLPAKARFEAMQH